MKLKQNLKIWEVSVKSGNFFKKHYTELTWVMWCSHQWSRKIIGVKWIFESIQIYFAFFRHFKAVKKITETLEKEVELLFRKSVSWRSWIKTSGAPQRCTFLFIVQTTTLSSQSAFPRWVICVIMHRGPI